GLHALPERGAILDRQLVHRQVLGIREWPPVRHAMRWNAEDEVRGDGEAAEATRALDSRHAVAKAVIATERDELATVERLDADRQPVDAGIAPRPEMSSV